MLARPDAVRRWRADALVLPVDDLVAGLVRLLATPPCSEGEAGELRQPGKFTLANWHNWCGSTGSHSRIVTLPQDHPRQCQPDITLTREALDRESKVALHHRLEQAVAWCS